MLSTRKRNFRRRKQHVLTRAKESLGKTWKIVLEYLLAYVLESNIDKYIANHIVREYPKIIADNVRILSPLSWQQIIVESDNLELVRKFTFLCVGNNCPMEYLTHDSYEVYEYLKENNICINKDHKANDACFGIMIMLKEVARRMGIKV